MGDPDLVFLDEPTTGFDPAARRKSWELVEGLTALGKTILLTTHYLDEAQHLADRIVVLNQGRIVAEGTPRTLGADRATTIRFRGAYSGDLPAIGAGPEVTDQLVTYKNRRPDRRSSPAHRMGHRTGGGTPGSGSNPSQPGGGVPRNHGQCRPDANTMNLIGVDPGLVWRQIRHQNRVFWRTSVAAFFTLALPVFFLALFSVLFGNSEVAEGYRFAQFFAPAMAVFAAGTSTFTTLAIGTALARDQGILKRVRGTPLPPWIHMGGRIGSSVWIAVLSVVIMFGVGWAFFGFVMLWSNLGVALLVFVVGVATFSALGLSVCALVRNADSTPAVANAVFLPMAFISGIFIPLDDAPGWLVTVGDIFPPQAFCRTFRRRLQSFPRRCSAGLGGSGHHGRLVGGRTGGDHPLLPLGSEGIEVRAFRHHRRTASPRISMSNPPPHAFIPAPMSDAFSGRWTPLRFPRHVGVILDGHRRYARQSGLGAYVDSYWEGMRRFEDFVDWSAELGIPAVTAWALSKDNLGRSSAELEPIYEVLTSFLGRIPQRCRRSRYGAAFHRKPRSSPFGFDDRRQVRHGTNRTRPGQP